MLLGKQRKSQRRNNHFPMNTKRAVQNTIKKRNVRNRNNPDRQKLLILQDLRDCLEKIEHRITLFKMGCETDYQRLKQMEEATFQNIKEHFTAEVLSMPLLEFEAKLPELKEKYPLSVKLIPPHLVPRLFVDFESSQSHASAVDNYLNQLKRICPTDKKDKAVQYQYCDAENVSTSCSTQSRSDSLYTSDESSTEEPFDKNISLDSSNFSDGLKRLSIYGLP